MRLTTLFMLAALAGSVPETSEEAEPADKAWIIFGTDTVTAEVADRYEERVEGLKFRNEVPDGTGMLFVFESESAQSFWMKDTYIDLDIAFMNRSFRIVDIQTMTAGSEEVTDSRAPAMFALEVRAGWFAEKGIEVGATAEVVFDPGR